MRRLHDWSGSLLSVVYSQEASMPGAFLNCMSVTFWNEKPHRGDFPCSSYGGAGVRMCFSVIEKHQNPIGYHVILRSCQYSSNHTLHGSAGGACHLFLATRTIPRTRRAHARYFPSRRSSRRRCFPSGAPRALVRTTRRAIMHASRLAHQHETEADASLITVSPYLRPNPRAGGCAPPLPFFPFFPFALLSFFSPAADRAMAETRLGSGAAAGGVGDTFAGNPRATHCCVTHFSSTADSAVWSVLGSGCMSLLPGKKKSTRPFFGRTATPRCWKLVAPPVSTSLRYTSTVAARWNRLASAVG
mmetsp:Transcript_19011/g.41626  ORF Transcript_19011/g.41626 Transcript_19011/m.41626 type:complete len:302 (-) Transcript_19011:254-1159(-)